MNESGMRNENKKKINHAKIKTEQAFKKAEKRDGTKLSMNNTKRTQKI